MNWEGLGAIGEIAGAIAVVATLIYFARQIRDTQRISMTANMINISEMQIDHRNTINANIMIWTKGNAGEPLDVLDQSIYQNLIRNYDTTVFLSYYQTVQIQRTDAKKYKSATMAHFISFLHQNPGARKVLEELQKQNAAHRNILLGDNFNQEIGPTYHSLLSEGLKSLDEQDK